jgi:hypothetical protein
MLHTVVEFLRRRYVLLQCIAALFWLTLDVMGLGFGVIDGLLRRPLTSAEGRGAIFGSAPPGPVRLTRSERAIVQQRLSAAFNGSVPKYITLSDLKSHYTLKPHSLCDWRGANVASDPTECNQLGSATPFFQALLVSMHPRVEILMQEELRNSKGDTVTLAFIVGPAGKPQILFDLSRVNTGTWDVSKGFVLKAYHGNGLTDLTLGKPLGFGRHLYLIDDPGKMQRRRGMCAEPPCPAELLLYGFDYSGGRNSNGQLASSNLVDIAITNDLEKRFDLFAALLGSSVTLPPALPPEPFKVERFAVTKFNTMQLGRKIDGLFGPGAATRVLYSPVGYHVAFGTVYGIAIDGKLYTLWDGGSGYASLGTDRFVFDVIDGGKVTRLEGVASQAGVYALPYSGSVRGTKPKLEVRKFTAQGDAPWSSFENFAEVFGSLRDGVR